jgi:FlaA1/EpsC-like NDP-sugar epimerase
VRDPQIEDLLGRTTVSTDLEAVERLLADKRVLITGAGGSIGAEIARQVAGFKPTKLVLLDHDETHLYEAASTIPGPCTQVLADITDRDGLFEVFLRHRPEVVFHAAAHKHVPVLEEYPVEAARVNVFGTLHALRAAVAVGTPRFVLISTDKAVQPVSVMGASKRLGELLVMANDPPGASYCSVRFGNVLGSRGSVIPTFARQIAEGGPVTVTDPRMTRYFMSVEEAVQLVLQASVLSRGGETFVLEMGEAVNILELAERMIRLSGYAAGSEIPIRIVGRRPGEKLHEDLRELDEALSPTAHPSIKCLKAEVEPLQELLDGLPRLAEATGRRDGALVRDLLFDLVAPSLDSLRAQELAH